MFTILEIFCDSNDNIISFTDTIYPYDNYYDDYYDSDSDDSDNSVSNESVWLTWTEKSKALCKISFWTDRESLLPADISSIDSSGISIRNGIRNITLILLNYRKIAIKFCYRWFLIKSLPLTSTSTSILLPIDKQSSLTFSSM